MQLTKNETVFKVKRMAEIIKSDKLISNTFISRSLNVSRHFVRKYKLRLKEIGLTNNEFIKLSNTEIDSILWKKPEYKQISKRLREIMRYFNNTRKLKKLEKDIKTVWVKYRCKYPKGYSYSQFTVHLHSWQKENGKEKIIINKWSVPYISEEEMKVLVKWRSSNNRRLWSRAVSIIESSKGIAIKTLCLKLEKNRRIIEEWIQAFLEKRLEGLKSSRERKKNQEIVNQIKKKHERIFEILHESPQLYKINRSSWSLDALSYAYKKKYNNPIGKSTISEYIRSEGYSFKKARRVLTSPDPEYRKKMDEIINILLKLGKDEKFFSIDEFGPVSIKIRGGRTYTPKGMTRVVPQWQRSKGRLILTGALELSTNQMTHFYSEKKNTDEMIKLLDIIIKQYSDQKRIYLSWDAASWHCSNKLQERVLEINSNINTTIKRKPEVKLAPLPSSAQFLNVIESVFSGMAKAVIHNSDYKNVEECKTAIDTYLSNRNKHYKEFPKKAGNKIWGNEQVISNFKPSNNCKDPTWR